MAQPVMRMLSLDEARTAMREALAEFEKPENKDRMTAVIAAAGGDPGKLMMTAMPLGVEIQRDLLVRYGFTPDAMGAMQMIMGVRMAAMADPELMAAVTLLQSKIMPTA